MADPGDRFSVFGVCGRSSSQRIYDVGRCLLGIVRRHGLPRFSQVPTLTAHAGHFGNASLNSCGSRAESIGIAGIG